MPLNTPQPTKSIRKSSIIGAGEVRPETLGGALIRALMLIVSYIEQQGLRQAEAQPALYGLMRVLLDTLRIIIAAIAADEG